MLFFQNLKALLRNIKIFDFDILALNTFFAGSLGNLLSELGTFQLSFLRVGHGGARFPPSLLARYDLSLFKKMCLILCFLML